MTQTAGNLQDSIVSVQLTPDAAAYAYSYHRILSDLLLIEGLTKD